MTQAEGPADADPAPVPPTDDTPQPRAEADRTTLPDDLSNDPAGHEPTADRVVLQLPHREATGDDPVDRALDELDSVGEGDLQDHLDAAEKAQDALQQRLAETGD